MKKVIVLVILLLALVACKTTQNLATEKMTGTAKNGDEYRIEKAFFKTYNNMKAGRYKMVSTDELKMWIDRGEKVVLLDVMPAEFYEENHLPDAINYEVKAGAEAPDKRDEEVLTGLSVAMGENKQERIVVHCGYLYCGRAHSALMLGAQEGYKNLYLYPGGTIAWKDGGYPLEDGKYYKKVVYTQEEIMENFHTEIEEGKKYSERKDIELRSRRKREKIEVLDIYGIKSNKKVEDSQYVVREAGGNLSVIEQKEVEDTYNLIEELPEGWKKYERVRGVRAILMDEELLKKIDGEKGYKIKTLNGREQIVYKGDYLISPIDSNEVYRVEKDDFEERYVEVKEKATASKELEKEVQELENSQEEEVKKEEN